MHSHLGSACAIHFELAHHACASIPEGIMAATMPNMILNGEQHANTAANKALAPKKRADRKKRAAEDEDEMVKSIHAH